MHGDILHFYFKAVQGKLEPGTSPVSLSRLYFFIFFPANSFYVQIKHQKTFSRDWESYSKFSLMVYFFLLEKNYFYFSLFLLTPIPYKLKFIIKNSIGILRVYKVFRSTADLFLERPDIT